MRRRQSLVGIGVTGDGHKVVLVVVSGYREWTVSWSWVLRGLKPQSVNVPQVWRWGGTL